MSKFVKDLITDHIKTELDGVSDLFVVNLVGLSANANSALRASLRAKNIRVMVVKNSLARRATEGTQLSAAFEGSDGMTTLVWGANDVVALAKEVTKLAENKAYAPFSAKGGVVGGAKISGPEVKAVSKWPSREEQLSLLLGQILSPGATLVGQLLGGGSSLASQIKQLAEKEDASEGETPAAADDATGAGGDAATNAPAAAGDAPAAAGDAPAAEAPPA